MNYYKARQRDSDHRWHYTKERDGSIWPIGYCAEPGRDCHVQGHATAEEAEECYRTHLLDCHLNLEGRHTDVQYRCQVCNAYTIRYAEIRCGIGQSISLCDQHCTREHVATVMGSYKEVISSV